MSELHTTPHKTTTEKIKDGLRLEKINKRPRPAFNYVVVHDFSEGALGEIRFDESNFGDTYYFHTEEESLRLSRTDLKTIAYFLRYVTREFEKHKEVEDECNT